MADRKADERNAKILTLATVAFVVAVMYVAREVVLPVAMATLLMFLLAPLVIWLERRGLGRIPAVLVVTLLLFVFVGGLGWIVVSQVTDLLGELPKHQETLVSRIKAGKGWFGQGSGRLAETLARLRTELTGEPRPDQVTPGGQPLPVQIVGST